MRKAVLFGVASDFRSSRTSPVLTSFFLAVVAFFLGSSPGQAQTSTIPTDTAPGDITVEAVDTSAADAAIRYPKIKSALDLFTSRNFQEAEDLLKEACEENKELPPAGVIVGTWYSRANIPQAARAAFERAVRDNPDDPEAYVVFGDNSIQQFRFTDAILLYEKSLEVLEDYNANLERRKNLKVRAESGIANVMEAREQWVEAEMLLRNVLEVQDDSLPHLNRLARALFKQKKEQEAYDVFKKMYRIDPEKSGRYEVLMAGLYQQDGREKNAAKLINKAITEDPDNVRTQLAAATWALQTGDDKMADKAIKAAIALEPDNVQARLIQSVISRKNNDYESAEKTLRTAMAADPANSAILNQLAITTATQDSEDKGKQGLEFAQMAVKLSAENNAVNREVAVTLAYALERAGKSTEAQRQLQSALQSGGVNGDAAYMAAYVLHKNGKSDMAVQVLQNAVETEKGIFPMRDKAFELLQRIKGS